MTKLTKVPLTARAVLQRINRKLGEQQRQLRAAQGKERDSLGDYYVVDLKNERVRDHDVDLEALARRMGCMREWEELRK
jgi:hypothetical protein